jgi:hypothetical protein
MNPHKLGIILLAIATALIHLTLAFSALFQGDKTTFIMFLLNGIGYLVILAAYYLPFPIAKKYSSLVRWAFIVFTGVTITGWVAIGARNWTAYIDKLIEVALIVLLITDKSKKGNHGQP